MSFMSSGKAERLCSITAGGLGLSYDFAFVNLQVWRNEEQTLLPGNSLQND